MKLVYEVCTGLLLPQAPVKRKFLGSGFFIGARQQSHGYPVAPHDSGGQLEQVTERDFHPSYGYPLEAGSCTTWPRADIDFNK